MNQLSLEEAILEAGGTSTANNRPSLISATQYLEMVSTLDSLGAHFTDILESADLAHIGGPLVLTNRPSFSCSAKRLPDGSFALFVPMGVPARLRVLARLLLRFWGKESRVQVVRSVFDNIPNEKDSVPPQLRPVFLEELTPDLYWDELNKLDESIEIDDIFENDVRELVHLGLVFMASHEFSHVLHGHFDLLSRKRTEDLGIDRSELRKGMEVDADAGASAIAMRILMKDVERAAKSQSDVSIERGWLRLAYVVTLVFAITDSHRKFAYAYQQTDYNHPMVRCELFFSSAAKSISGSEEAKQLWQKTSTEGWMRCIFALNDLTLEAYSGKYGHLPDGVPHAPLHALIYSPGFGDKTDLWTREEMQKSLSLVNKIRAFLPIFTRSKNNAEKLAG